MAKKCTKIFIGAQQPGTNLSRLTARQSEIFKQFQNKAFFPNVLEVFYICRTYELPSDSDSPAILKITDV